MEASVISFPLARQRRSSPSLSDQECFAVAAALCHRRNPWMPTRDEDFDGSVIMALLPYGGEGDPDYVIRRSLTGFFLEDQACRQPFSTLTELLETLNRKMKN